MTANKLCHDLKKRMLRQDYKSKSTSVAVKIYFEKTIEWKRQVIDWFEWIKKIQSVEIELEFNLESCTSWFEFEIQNVNL